MSDIIPVLLERNTTHGNFEANADCAMDLKGTLLRHMNHGLTNTKHHALDMICMKLARICTGDSTFADHWLDIIGYATLALHECEMKDKQ